MDGHEPQVDEVPVTRDPTGSAWTAVLVLAWTVCGPSFGRAALVTVPPLVVVHLLHRAVRRRLARRPGDAVPAGAPSVTVTGPPDPACHPRPPDTLA